MNQAQIKFLHSVNDSTDQPGYVCVCDIALGRFAFSAGGSSIHGVKIADALPSGWYALNHNKHVAIDPTGLDLPDIQTTVSKVLEQNRNHAHKISFTDVGVEIVGENHAPTKRYFTTPSALVELDAHAKACNFTSHKLRIMLGLKSSPAVYIHTGISGATIALAIVEQVK